MTVKHLIATALLSSSTFSFSACARNDMPSISICNLIDSPARYDRRRMELHAGVVAEPHGYHLVGSECVGGSVELVIPERSDNDAKFTQLMRQVMAHHAKGDLVITGTFHATRSGHPTGTFVIDDVLKVVTADGKQ